MPPSFTKGCHLWSSVSLRSIGVVRTPYAKRSDCPRQGRLNPQVRGVIYLHPWLNPDLVDGLRGFSHMWCIFYMHRNHRNIQGEELPARIRPPSGGDKKGLLATRAPHRPCGPLGLSCLKIEDILTSDSNTTGSRRNKCVLQQDVSGMQAEETDCIDVDDPSAIPNIENNFSIRIEVSNLDILDNTPVLDIKPYIPVYDSFPGATISHWLEEGLQRRSS
eukprot:TRINITY_DN8014_c0_g1_i2.p1 TRINITY_DN8014_c0_g1~~TRINITY_DN8014_c0_g1_i2.p1  ORF type:complete len:219 (+),score=25.17 TRINITY_DN8014_c0_g1_i2:105-761(+)